VGTGGLIGRDAELERLRDFLSARPRPAVLLLEGQAGIGKTTLWNAALSEVRGQPLLRCRPAPAEAQLAFAALSDLLGPVVEDVLPALAPPQRRALRVALLLEEAGTGALDTRLLGAALLSALRTLGPAVVAIDDVQWLDQPSRSVLAFALRRLTDEPLALLIARRGDGSAEPPFDFSVERFLLEPLSMGAMHALLHERLGISFSRPVVRRLHESSGGNPFYALELGRALQRRGAMPRPDQPLPLPDSLQRVVEERLAALPDPSRAVLELVAGLLDPRLVVVERLADAPGAIDAAIAAGVLELAGERLAFTHPLLASAVYDQLGPERRRALHRTLAKATVGEEEHAIHLAMSSVDADAAIAATLAEAADGLARRGALDAAARLGEHAARLTPANDPELAGRRAISAAERYTAAGDPAHARVIVTKLAEAAQAGPTRAAALSLAGWANLGDIELAAAAEVQRNAAEEARGDPATESTARMRLAVIEQIRQRLGEALDQAKLAVEAAEVAGDHRLLMTALSHVGYVRAMMGAGLVDESERAVEMERGLGEFLGMQSPSLDLADVLTWMGRHDESRELLLTMLEQAVIRGDEETRGQVLLNLGYLERTDGKLLAAERYARDAMELWRQGGNEQEVSSAYQVLAGIDALQGRLDEARSTATEGLAACERIGDATFALHSREVLGLIELTAGDPLAAQRWLEPASDEMLDSEIGEFSIYPAIQYEVEALVALGSLERAELLVAHLEDRARSTRRELTAALALRGRAMLLAAGGDLDAARSSLQEALEIGFPQPFEHARTLLALGALERRAKRKRAARDALERAVECFDSLPSPPWADKARAELARLGLRSAPGALTETETRIAELAAAGMSNPEIAAAVFVSRKTVEANLSKIYRKLGVRSRVELARRLPG
jgi:DNA-binding CsgD family transcriptional regulator